MTVNSKLGEGAIFTLLPPVSESAAIADMENYQESIIGQGRILLIDNEEFIREVTGRASSYWPLLLQPAYEQPAIHAPYLPNA